MTKRYHDSLRRIYSIIAIEISDIDLEITLQMTFKTLNNSIEFDDLIFTLLIFDVYSRMIEMNVSSFTIIQRAIAMKKIMKEMRKFNAIRQMNDALNTRNDSNFLIYNLSLNSSVLIFREDKNINQSESWQESFKLLNIQKKSVIIELSNDSIKFKSILIKSYHQDENVSLSDVDQLNMSSSFEFQSFDYINSNLIIDSIMFIIDESTSFIESIKRDRDRFKKYSASIVNVIFNIISIDSSFIAFRQKEIVDLLEKEIFLSINKRNVSLNIRIFNSRFVDEVKNSDTEKAFEKFRLMMQTLEWSKQDSCFNSVINHSTNQSMFDHLFNDIIISNEVISARYYLSVRTITIKFEQRFFRSIILWIDQTDEHFI